jgi:putative transposase
LLGAAWQRCRVRFLRIVLAHVPKGSAEMVCDQLDVIAGMLGRKSAKAESMLRDAAVDLLAFTGFPPAHSKKIWSTNSLERLNNEVKRRTDGVGCSPTTRRC